MPYEGEFAGYRALRRITECDRVKQLLGRSKTLDASASTAIITPQIVPELKDELPKFVLAIDGSKAEVDVKTGYPGAKIGYCTVAAVLLDMDLLDDLDKQRPVDPIKFRETETASTIDAALPGSNIVTRRQTSARASFREELFDLFQNIIIDDEDNIPLINTYEKLLAKKPQGNPMSCPYSESDGCDAKISIGSGYAECPKCKKLIYSTDALRIHERFNELGSNGEAFGLVMQVWERILLVHLLLCFEKREILNQMGKIAFFIDGPLAVFGPPAWLSAAISLELKRINAVVHSATGNDLTILGVEKTGEFVVHFDEIDQTENAGESRFDNRSFSLLTDSYIKERIQKTISQKRYGIDTYFGRKFFYKTKNGARIVATIPFLNEAQDTLNTADIALYPNFALECNLLDRLACSRFPNSLSPLVSAHAQAAIPLQLGTKVLQQLARALMSSK
jgi:hypothetical protein